MKNLFRYFPGTSILAFMIVVGFVYEIVVGFDKAIMQFAQINLYVYLGEFWRVITAIFIHMGYIHFALNLFWLIYLGMDLEGLLGSRKFIIVFFSGAVIGNILSLFVLPPFVASGGASGGLFAIVGALLAVEGVLRKNMQKALINALFLFLINSIFPGVNYVAHFGGLIVGILLGYIYGKDLKRKLLDMSYWFS
ncbi:rhomboid family intramembrane serine protease [Pyrococcus furiosus DSM 3638]|uniref:Peptidase S54 rhomboid domain-containing protein n=3 Tax=Pyrococcus furiosus TaxID=2261 RepID=Q8U1H9_PYRFU|nr:rhomboid family intramembrane serine protease [Pyrococcus furiosus]AAL81352.1 hypothetical protein PF1228 [Pyrococcus furiosus DSM 3638]AFN04015.1 hypothetical protein PFC_05360 [Pyrococcus furiosus COM1]QEK78872.1 rhomboid family intramembrane serine protease [Pyrococcus furiosus DSM 3638]